MTSLNDIFLSSIDFSEKHLFDFYTKIFIEYNYKHNSAEKARIIFLRKVGKKLEDAGKLNFSKLLKFNGFF